MKHALEIQFFAGFEHLIKYSQIINSIKIHEQQIALY